MKFFFPRLLNKLGILKKINIQVKIKLGDYKISIPIIKTIGLRNLFMTEIWMIQVLKKIIPLKEGVFLDVGINIGQTLIKLKSVNRDMKYIGFEPNPLCVFYSNELIKQNNFQNCTIIPAGIYTSNKILTLNLFSENELDSAASIIEEFRPDPIARKMFVPVFDIETLQDKEAILNKVSILKIDVEGGELEVLSSFRSIIKENRPFILIEILPIYKEDNTFRIDRQNKIESLIKEMEYVIYRILKNQDDTFLSFEKLSTINIHSDLGMCDYVLVPTEMEESFN